MIWNDERIRAAGESMIAPFEPQQVRQHGAARVVSYGVSSYGYDVRLGNCFQRLKRGAGFVLDPKRNDAGEWESFSALELAIDPGECVLGVTFERVSIPDTVLALCVGKSTYARLGLVVNTTPLEPGWEGHVTLELSNTSRVPVRVYPGEGIAQLLFLEGDAPAVTYAARGGKYQNQGNAPVRGFV